MARHRIVLADDHVLVREGIKMILASRPEFEIIGEAGDGLELLNLLKRGPAPDAVIIDISMPKIRGIEAIPELKAAHPDLKVLMLTMHKDDDLLRQAFISGADGYLLKEDVAKELFSALDTILDSRLYVSPLLGDELRDDWLKIHKERGGVPAAQVLSFREKEVLKLIAEGKSSKEIAGMLYISARTVERHRANIMEKLGLKGTADLTKYALTKGYIS